MIGISGAHRVGKSTLAKTYAEKFGVSFIPYPGAREVYAAMGAHQGVDYPLDVRLMIQENILDHAEAFYKGLSGRQRFLTLTDRTPIDFMAYLEADVGRSDVTPELDFRINFFMDRARRLTQMYFPMVLIVMPGIPYHAEEGAPPPNLAYQNKVAHLITGIGYEVAHGEHTQVCYLGRAITDMDARMKQLNAFIGGYHRDALAESRESVQH